MVKNFMENVVDDMMEEVLDTYSDICKCAKCRDDIKAISLNGLRPTYVSTSRGEIYKKVSELEAQFRIDAIREITLAIAVVSRRPNH